MTPEDQLDVVERYLTPYKGRVGSLKDMYMAVLSPGAVGADEGRVLFRQGTPAYAQNAGLDRDQKGHVTVGDAVASVLRFIGLQPSVASAATLDQEMAREMRRARGETDDDVSQQYLQDKNAAIDDEMARAFVASRAPEPTRQPPDRAPTMEAPQSFFGRMGQDALQVLGGARDAFVETMQTLNLLGDWMREKGIGPNWKAEVSVPEVPRTEAVEGDVIRGVSQFLTAFLPATRLVGVLGATGRITSGMAAGAVADFAAFDPQSPRMSNLLNDLAPALRNPITDYLAAQPDDSEAEGRLKNTLEGLGLGALTDGIFAAARTMRQARQLGQQAGDAVSQGLREGAAEATGTATPAQALRQTQPSHLGQLTDEQVQSAIEAERTATAARHATRVQRTEQALEAVQQGSTDVIERELTQAGAVVAQDGSVVLGRGQNLRRFDSAADAATTLLEERIARLSAETPTYSPLAAIKRALDVAEETQPPTTGPRAPLAQLLPDEQVNRAQQFISLEASGSSDLLERSGKTVHVNFDRINTSDDIKRTIATVAEIVRDEAEAQGRGTQTIAEIAQGSVHSPYRRLEQILQVEPGTALNAEDAYAVRQVWVSSANRLHELASRMAQGDLSVTDDFLKQFVIASNIHVSATGVRAEAGRALRVFGVDMPATDRQFLARFSAIIAESNDLPIEAVATRIAQLPGPEQLAKFLRDAQQVTRADMFTEVWYGALLSAPPTHVVNALDGALRAAWAIPERYLATAFGNPRDIVTNFQAANAFAYGMTRSLQEAWQYAAHAFRTGASRFGVDATKVEAPLRPALTAANLGVEETFLGGMVDLLGAAFRAPGKALLSVDEFFKTVNYRAALHEGAFRRATEEGLEGQELASRIVALVNEPLPSLKEQAVKWANYNTLSTPLDEAGAAFENFGRATQRLADAREDFLPLKIVLPFIRTPFNIARFAAERTPVLGNFSQNVNRALVAGGAEGALARSKMALGTGMLALFGMLAHEGTITGKAPQDPALRQHWERLGIQEYSVRIGETWYSYNRLDLVGLPMGLMADFAQIAREETLSSLEQTAGAILGAVFNALTSKTYLKGVAETVDAIAPGRGETEQQTGRQFGQWLSQRLSSLVPPGNIAAVSLLARTLDPVQREARTLVDKLLTRLPGASHLAPAALDLWGRERLRAEPVGPDLLSPFLSREYQGDPVDEELLRQKVPIRMPERVISIEVPGRRVNDEIPLTPAQYRRYVELSAGKRPDGSSALKDELRNFMQSEGYNESSDGPKGGKSDGIQDMVFKFREAALAQLRQEDPAIDALLTERDVTRRLGSTRAGQEQLPEVLRGLGIGRR
jgi:hypothetical protein